MGLRDIGAVKDTTDVELYHPATAELLLNADKTPMTITVHGPYSEKFKAVQRAQMNRRLARAQRAGRSTEIKAEQVEAETLEQLLKCVEAWNITVKDEPEPFSEDNVRAVFDEFPWVREQVEAAFGDARAFLDTSAKT